MVASCFAALAALIHVFIFYLESLAWGAPSTNRLFGVGGQDAEACRLMAFNQGFYNLFLALAIVGGTALQLRGNPDYGIAIVDYACVSILGAGLILFFSRPKLIRPALIQGLPALGYLGFRFLGY